MLTAIISVDLATIGGYDLRPQDVVCVSAGGRSLKVLSETVRRARVLYPRNRVYMSTGPKRLAAVSTIPDVDCILLDYERSMVESAGRTWSWDWGHTLGEIGAITTPARDRYGLLVTASPLLNKTLIRQGVRWQYPMFSEMAACTVILQTQGFIKRGTFTEAMVKLAAQHTGKLDRLNRLGFVITLDPDQPNYVSPSKGAQATREAVRHGISTVYLFGLEADKNQRFLQLVQGLR